MTSSAFAGWSAYRDAVVDIEAGDHKATLAPEGVIAGEVWTSVPVYVITAYNPGGAVDPAANHAAQNRLHDHLLEKGIAWLPAVGRSRDGVWQEPSVAVTELSEDEALALGREFGQDAIFCWDGEHLSVLACDTGTN